MMVNARNTPKSFSFSYIRHFQLLCYDCSLFIQQKETNWLKQAERKSLWIFHHQKAYYSFFLNCKQKVGLRAKKKISDNIDNMDMDMYA